MCQPPQPVHVEIGKGMAQVKNFLGSGLLPLALFAFTATGEGTDYWSINKFIEMVSSLV